MDHSEYEVSVLQIFADKNKEAKLIDGYVTFEIVDDTILVEQYFFYEDNIKLKSSKEFLLQSMSLIDDLYKYKRNISKMSLEITGGILVFNQGSLSIAWL